MKKMSQNEFELQLSQQADLHQPQLPPALHRSIAESLARATSKKPAHDDAMPNVNRWLALAIGAAILIGFGLMDWVRSRPYKPADPIAKGAQTKPAINVSLANFKNPFPLAKSMLNTSYENELGKLVEDFSRGARTIGAILPGGLKPSKPPAKSPNDPAA